jgi:dUTPase
MKGLVKKVIGKGKENVRKTVADWLLGENEIKFKKLCDEARIPVKSFEHDAAFNMWATEMDAHTHPSYISYKTGIALELPVGVVALLFARSSVREKLLSLANCVGVLDASYRGEVIFSYRRHKVEYGNTDIVKKLIEFGFTTEAQFNTSVENERAYFKSPITDKYYMVGDKIGQVLFIRLDRVVLKEVTELSTSPRLGGHGSTGRV